MIDENNISSLKLNYNKKRIVTSIWTLKYEKLNFMQNVEAFFIDTIFKSNQKQTSL